MRSLSSRLFSNRRYKKGVYVLSNTAAGRRQPFYEWSKRERFDYTKKAAPIGAEFNKQRQKRLAHERRVERDHRALERKLIPERFVGISSDDYETGSSEPDGGYPPDYGRGSASRGSAAPTGAPRAEADLEKIGVAL